MIIKKSNCNKVVEYCNEVVESTVVMQKVFISKYTKTL